MTSLKETFLAEKDTNQALDDLWNGTKNPSSKHSMPTKYASKKIF